MRLWKPVNGSASFSDYFTVLTYLLPRIFISLYLLTVCNSNVAASKHKPSTSRIPTIRQTNSSYTYQVGDRAVLKCAIQNLGSKIVIWRKTSETHPLTVGAMTFDPEKRYEVENVSEKGEWNLFIKNVTHKDAGIYECQVSTKERYIRRLVQVIVKDREYKIPAITIAGTESVVKGKTISLYCNVTGGKQAPDDLDWLKDNKKLTSSRSGRINLTKHISGITLSTASNLTINQVTQTDSGIYTCRSTGMAKNITVDVTNKGQEKRGATKDVPSMSSATSAISVYYFLIAVCVQCSSYSRLYTLFFTLLILSCTHQHQLLTMVLR